MTDLKRIETMNKRGMLTDEIKSCAVNMLGREINQKELRLMPYVQYCAMNSQNIEPARINQDEREILTKWRFGNLIRGGASDLVVSKRLWDAMSQILWLAYVNK